MTKLCTVYISGKEQKVLIVYPDGKIQILSLNEWKDGAWTNASI